MKFKAVFISMILCLFVNNVSKAENVKITNYIIQQLSSAVSDHYSQVTVEILSKLPNEAQEVSLELPKNVVGLNVVHVRYWNQGIVTDKFVQYKMTLYDDVPVVRHTINRKARLNPTDIEIQRKDITETVITQKKIIYDISILSNTRAVHFINKGAMLTQDLLEPRPIVEAGHAIELTAQLGDVHANIPVIALEEGFENRLIKIKNLRSNKVMQATVIDANHVRFVN